MPSAVMLESTSHGYYKSFHAFKQAFEKPSFVKRCGIWGWVTARCLLGGKGKRILSESQISISAM